MPTTTNQDHFRVRTDLTSADSGTPVWGAAQDVNYSIQVSTKFRIRFAVSNTGGAAATTTRNLYISRNAGAYAQSTTSATFIQSTDATGGASADDSTIFTQLLTGVGTFNGVGQYDTTGTTGVIAWSAGTCNELEYGLIITASAATGDTFDFQVRNSTSTFNNYFKTPRITVVAGASLIVAPRLKQYLRR